MTISVRSRRDVVIMDPERFLAAARQAYRDLNPQVSEDDVINEITDIHDAVHAILDRDGQLAADALRPPGMPTVGPGGRRPGDRVTDRPDGLSPAGWVQWVVRDEVPLHDRGCFLPRDPFRLPERDDGAQ
jgi:hypothetical protein